MSRLSSAVVIVHFNKTTARKGKPWTIHTRGTCIQVARVVFKTTMESVFKPEKKSNPRAWFKAKGTVSFEGETAVIT